MAFAGLSRMITSPSARAARGAAKPQPPPATPLEPSRSARLRMRESASSFGAAEAERERAPPRSPRLRRGESSLRPVQTLGWNGGDRWGTARRGSSESWGPGKTARTRQVPCAAEGRPNHGRRRGFAQTGPGSCNGGGSVMRLGQVAVPFFAARAIRADETGRLRAQHSCAGPDGRRLAQLPKRGSSAVGADAVERRHASPACDWRATHATRPV